MFEIAMYLLCWLLGVFAGLMIARSAVRHHEQTLIPLLIFHPERSEGPFPNSDGEAVEICGATWYRIS